MWEYWLREADSDVPAWSPYDPETGQVVLGLTMVADQPPFGGVAVGSYRWDEDGLTVTITEELT